MPETLSIKMLDSPETAQAELDEPQKHYSQGEIDRLEGELSPLDALATFMRLGVIIPPYPPACHIINGRHLHGCGQKVKHVSDTDEFKRLELTGENTIVDLVKTPFSDLDSQIHVVRSRTPFKKRSRGPLVNTTSNMTSESKLLPTYNSFPTRKDSAKIIKCLSHQAQQSTRFIRCLRSYDELLQTIITQGAADQWIHLLARNFFTVDITSNACHHSICSTLRCAPKNFG